MRRINRSQVMLALVMLALAHPAWALDRRGLLPGDVTMTVRVTDTSRLVGALTNSPLGRMWADGKIQKFLGEPNLTQMILDSEAERLGSEELANLQMDEYKMLKDEIVLGFAYAGKDSHYYGAARLERDDYLQSLEMDKRMAELGRDRMEIIRHEYQGTMLIELVGGSAGVERTDWQAHVGSTLVGSDRREWVERTIVRLKGEVLREPAVAEPELEVSVSGAALVTMLSDSFNKRKAAGNMPGAGAPGAAQVIDGDAVVRAMGLSTVGRCSLILRFAAEQLEIATHAELGKERTGLLRVLATRPLDLSMQIPYVEDDIFSLKIEQYDLAAVWAEVPRIVRAINPMAEGMLQVMTLSFGIDIGQDILNHLGSTYITVARIHEGNAEQLTVWELKNGRALEESLARLLGEGGSLSLRLGQGLKRDSFRGHPLYVIEPGPDQPSLGIAVAGPTLLMGAPEMVRSSLRALDAEKEVRNPFTRSTVYQKLLRGVPRGSFLFGVVDWGRLVKQTLGKVTSREFEQWKQIMQMMQRNRGAPGKAGPFSNINWDQSPTFDELAKFLGPSVSYAIDEHGVISSRFILYYPASE